LIKLDFWQAAGYPAMTRTGIQLAWRSNPVKAPQTSRPTLKQPSLWSAAMALITLKVSPAGNDNNIYAAGRHNA
jgi:hypothetical protein